MLLIRCLQSVHKLTATKVFTAPLTNLTFSQLQHQYSTNAKRFTDKHEWVQVDDDVGTIGITNYAQESLGDVVFAQLPEPNMVLLATDECGALESVKAASELYSPVSGVVTEKNQGVEDKPSLINSSCYEKGWLFKLRLTEPQELEKLMTEEEYEKYLKTDAEKNAA